MTTLKSRKVRLLPLPILRGTKYLTLMIQSTLTSEIFFDYIRNKILNNLRNIIRFQYVNLSCIDN